MADDDLIVREGVCRLLQRGGRVEVVAAVGDAEALLAAVVETAPDAVLTDIRMPPGRATDGIVAAKRIRNDHPGTGVVVLSQHADASYVVDLLEDGAEGLGYLLKERIGDPVQLVHALEETSRGGSVVDPVLVDTLVRRRRLSAESGVDTLTPRELDVLQHMAAGLSNAAIAQALAVSESSVEKASNALFAKLGLTSEPTTHRRVSAVVTYLRAMGGAR
ncbi:response regulator [Nocardioides coralli]|uniref:response regulator n=1 Tax=Nocardioides coralli TaxID=2872154 RepID=UPI001CA41F2B|nr:response regulator transcription factor [Nocardioides coralli]QZY28921.1 response regulator transcription factor [Nocardioides coralli]